VSRADDAIRGYTCPRDRGGCGAGPGQRCVRIGANLGTRTLLHPHRVRVELVARPARGPADARLASWVRDHAPILRYALDFTGRHSAEGDESAEAMAALGLLERMIPAPSSAEAGHG
jgi:hypothetical protein